MTIDPLGPIEPPSNFKKLDKPERPRKTDQSDTINVSSEARYKAEVYHATELAKRSPEIRMDRVQEIKKKLEDPSYISDWMIDQVADRIMESFGI